MKKIYLRKADIILISIIIGVSILSILSMKYYNTRTEEKNIIISVDNEVVRKIPIQNTDKNEIYEFNFGKETGYVEIKNNEVRMLEMDKKVCPKGICSKMGWIHATYQSIVCLPNKIIVSIEGNKTDSTDNIDIIAQ